MQTLKIKAKAEKIKAEKQNRHLFDTMRRNIVTKNEICLETRAKLALMLNLCWTRTYSSLLCIKMWKKKQKTVQWRLHGTHVFLFLPSLFSVFLLLSVKMQIYKMKLCYNMLQFAKETQISTVSNTQGRAKLRR